MSHPPEDALVGVVDTEVAAHLVDCPRCRVTRRLLAAAERKAVSDAEWGVAKVSLDDTRDHCLQTWNTPPGAPVRSGGVPAPWFVEGEIGRGAMATVYRVRNVEDGRLAALKVPEGHATRRMPREARLQEGLVHPHVVRCFGVLRVDGHDAILMELVEGPNLQEVLDRGPLPADARMELAVQILDGVAAVHGAGLVHRDLKPANILIGPSPSGVAARIGDFGLIKHLAATRMTRTGARMGTPGYMAPEQLSDAGRVGHEADLFALGAMLYELFTDEDAFQGANLVELLGAIQRGGCRDPHRLRKVLPPILAASVVACLEADPRYRPASAEGLLRLWEPHRPVRLHPSVVAEILHGCGEVDAREPLPERLVHALDVAMQLPAPFGLDDLAEALGEDMFDAMDVLAELVGVGVVSRVSEVPTFRCT